MLPEAMQPAGQPVVRTAGPNQKTMAVDLSQPAGAGTMMLPNSAGVVAFAKEEALRAREAAVSEVIPATPASIFFWLAWVVIGIGAGLAIHFYRARGGSLPGRYLALRRR